MASSVTVDPTHYVGTELELFAEAKNWKAYFSRSLARWVQGDVLEVGAGIGTNTHELYDARVRSWLCLEPDAALAEQAKVAVADLPNATVTVGTTVSAAASLGHYDSVLYIDVLEHIEDDRGELARAATLLRDGGYLVVLCPAHQALYSELDRAVGHFRRYNAETLSACGPSGLALEKVFYLDAVGMLASFANRALLKSGQPSLGQIKVWDRLMIPLSRVIDACVGRRLGKSVIAVWRRVPSGASVG
ncbi:MAG TPA: class I SAM-dependent methyltransferase [Polyangiaceae bacterium]|nr:class I SAM-dependent methyltransferase [Polyangiaceae bacterium]